MSDPARLDIWDYIVFSILVVLSSCVGIYHIIKSRKVKNPEEFLIKRNDLGIIPLILSAAASFVSAIGILGFSSETYQYGIHVMLVNVANLMGIPIGLCTFLPVFYTLQLNSIYEYFELRFNRFVKLCASTIMTLQLMLYTSCAVYAPALALNQVTGLHLWASVASIGVMCMLYTAMGGIKAVVWVDAVQLIVMIVVMTLIVVKGIINVGGFSEIWRFTVEGQRSDFFIMKPSNQTIYTVWTFLIGGTWHLIGASTVSQLMMQRYNCNKTLRDAKISFIGAVVTITILMTLITFSGLLLYATYHSCDPLLNGDVTSRDQMVALYAMKILSFGRGLPGVFIAAVMCATLSTLSSSLNSLATIMLQDYIKPYFPNVTYSRELLMAKVLAAINGVICMILVLFAESVGGVLKAVWIVAGVANGPVTAVFVMGMLLPWVNAKGAIAGFCAGVLFTGWASVGSLIFPTFSSAPLSVSGCDIAANQSIFNDSIMSWNNTAMNVLETRSSENVFYLYTLSPLWYGVWSILIGLPVAIIISILTGLQDPKTVDPKLLFPWTASFFKLLPKVLQEKIGFPCNDTYQHMPLSENRNTNPNYLNPNSSMEMTSNSLKGLIGDDDNKPAMANGDYGLLTNHFKNNN